MAKFDHTWKLQSDLIPRYEAQAVLDGYSMSTEQGITSSDEPVWFWRVAGPDGQIAEGETSSPVAACRDAESAFRAHRKATR